MGRKTIVDFTPGDGVFGEVAAEFRNRYFAIAINSDHSNWLHKLWNKAMLNYVNKDLLPNQIGVRHPHPHPHPHSHRHYTNIIFRNVRTGYGTIAFPIYLGMRL